MTPAARQRRLHSLGRDYDRRGPADVARLRALIGPGILTLAHLLTDTDLSRLSAVQLIELRCLLGASLLHPTTLPAPPPAQVATLPRHA